MTKSNSAAVQRSHEHLRALWAMAGQLVTSSGGLSTAQHPGLEDGLVEAAGQRARDALAPHIHPLLGILKLREGGRIRTGEVVQRVPCPSKARTDVGFGRPPGMW